MKKELVQVFEGIVSKDILDFIKNNYEAIATVNILQLGVDSLAIMKIVFRLEEILNMEVDYEKFNIESILTLESILDILNRGYW